MLRAMIVDDIALSAKQLKKILENSGDIEICHVFLNPLEAYDYAKANPIDIVFVDILMREMNGFRLSRMLLDLDAFIKVVFVTTCDDYAIQAFEMGALDYLKKPVTAYACRKRWTNLEGGIGEGAPRSWRFTVGGCASDHDKRTSTDRDNGRISIESALYSDTVYGRNEGS